jgi:hypothetical protein
MLRTPQLILALSGIVAAETEPILLLSEAESIKKCEGLAVAEDPVMTGKTSARWAGAGTGGVARLKHVPNDWSAQNLLVFDLHSNAPEKKTIVVTCESENAKTKGGDYFIYMLPVSWSGWREVRIPLGKFGNARKPMGWDQIESLNFYSRGWRISPVPGTVLHFDNMRLEYSDKAARRAPPPRKKTPHMKLPAWKGQLRFPGFPWQEILEFTKEDRLAGNLLKKLRRQFRSTAQKPIVTRKFKLEDIPEGERDGRYKYAGDNGEVFALAMHDCTTNGSLNARMVPVALAARLTEDKDLTDFVVRQLREVKTWAPLQRPGWTAYDPDRKLPPGGDGNWLATGYGMRAIVHTLSIMKDRIPQDLQEDMRALIQREVDSIVDDWRTERPWFVRSDFPGTNQWVLPSAALLYGCLFLGDEKNRDAYELGVQNLARTCVSQGDDGSWREGLGYGLFSAEYLFWAGWALARVGDKRLLGFGFTSNFSDWVTHMAMPGGYCVNAFDCGAYRLSDRPPNSLLLAALLASDERSLWAVDHLFPRIPDSMLGLLFRFHMAKAGKIDVGPEPFAAYPSQQLLTWRSDWDDQTAMGLWLRGGSNRDFHAHRDNGHISIYNGDEPILIESGTPNYANRDMPKFAKASGHNMLQAEEVIPRGKGCHTPMTVKSLDRDGGEVLIDGTNAFTDVEEWMREVKWHQDGWVECKDTVELNAPYPADKELFRFHTGATGNVTISGEGMAWQASWSDVVMKFTGSVPYAVAQFEWPDQSGFGKHVCLAVKTVQATRTVALQTRIEFKRKGAKFADLPTYQDYLAALPSAQAKSPDNAPVLVLQAEEMIGKDERFRISTKKVGAEKAFLNWDHVGQKIEAEIEIKQAGMYQVLLKNCTGANHGIPVRSLTLNGAVPFREAGKLVFPDTGGWSNETDDWVMTVLGEDITDDGFQFYLTAGKHKLTLVNEGGGGLNVDYLILFPAGMTKAEAVRQVEPNRAEDGSGEDEEP